MEILLLDLKTLFIEFLNNNSILYSKPNPNNSISIEERAETAQVFPQLFKILDTSSRPLPQPDNNLNQEEKKKKNL